MNYTEVIHRLRRSISEGQLVQLARERLNTDTTHGYPLALSDTLVLLQKVEDFAFDGFVLLRLEDISKVEHRPMERFFDHVLRAEGLLAAPLTPPPVRLDNWRVALEDIRRHYQHAILEREEPDDDMFYIGTLINVGPKKAALRYFLIEGVVETEQTLIPLKGLNSVRFDNGYTRCYAKYSREEHPN